MSNLASFRPSPFKLSHLHTSPSQCAKTARYNAEQKGLRELAAAIDNHTAGICAIYASKYPIGQLLGQPPLPQSTKNAQQEDFLTIADSLGLVWRRPPASRSTRFSIELLLFGARRPICSALVGYTEAALWRRSMLLK